MKIKLKCPKGHSKSVGADAAGTAVKCDECGHVWNIPSAATIQLEADIHALQEKIARAEADREAARRALAEKDTEIEKLKKDLDALRAKAPSGKHAKVDAKPAAAKDESGPPDLAALREKAKKLPRAAEPTLRLGNADAALLAEGLAASGKGPKADAEKPEAGPPDLAALREQAKKMPRPEGVQRTVLLGSDVTAAIMSEEGSKKESKDAKDDAKPKDGPPDLNALREVAKKQREGSGAQRTVLLKNDQLEALLAAEAKSGKGSDAAEPEPAAAKKGAGDDASDSGKS